MAIITIQNIIAQIPGYQGKRFFAEIGVSLFPNLGSATAQNKGAKTFPFGYNTGVFAMKDYYSFSFYYIIGRKINIKAGYTYQVAGLDMDVETPSILYPGYKDRRDLFYQLYMHDANFFVDFHVRKNLTPLGFYGSFGLRFIFVKEVLRDQKVDYPDNRTSYTPVLDQLGPLPENPLVVVLGLSGRMGYRTVLFNRIILNLAFDITLCPQHLSIASISSVNYYVGAVRAIADRYILGVYIGVGALLF